MALVSYTDFHGYWLVTGAASPIPDKVTGGRSLTLSGGATSPRSASYSRRRGSEFRTSTFAASEPAVYKSPGSDGLNTALYASSKIKSFTWAGRIRPQRTGSTITTLVPVGGIFSPTNMGGTANLYNQPCFVAVPGGSGSSKLLVFVGDKVFDTEYATQTSGPTSTTPISDEGWNAVGVSVVGSTTTNNQIDSVTVYTEDSSGVRRTYTLGARKAAARFNWTGQPSDGDTVTIDGVVHTFKTSLGGGTAATSTIAGTGVQPAVGETLTIDGVTYTFRNTIAGTYAKATIEIHDYTYFDGNAVAETNKGEIYLRIGGYVFYILFGTNGVAGKPAGYLDGTFSAYYLGPDLQDILNGSRNNKAASLSHPLTPTWSAAGEYTEENGQVWDSASRVEKWVIESNNRIPSTTWEVVISATEYGAKQIPVVVIDGWKWGPTGSQTGKPNTWRMRVKSGSVDNTGLWATYDDGNGKTQGVTKGGAAAPGNYAILLGATWADTRANIKKAIEKSGVEGVNYVNVTAANPGVASVATSGANDLILTSSYSGDAGNGKIVSDTSAQLTTANFSTGGSGSSVATHVLIGTTAALSWANLVACLNGTGSKGIDYGNGSSVAHATCSGEAGSSFVGVRARTAGSAGNSIALSKSCASIASIKDEFNDIAATTLLGGCAAGAWVVGAGARPDQTDLKVYLGGLHSTPNGTKGTFYGVIGDHALSNRAWTADDFGEYVTTPPPTSTRDRGWYRTHARMSYQARTETMSAWRGRQTLPVGNMTPVMPITLSGSRCAFRFWGVEAGRPFSVARLGVDQYKRGGLYGPNRHVYTFDGVGSGGLDKSSAKESVKPAALADVLNMGFHHKPPRRRRGYRILVNDQTGSEQYPMAFFDATTSSGEVFHLLYRGGSLYSYDNEQATVIDTGWQPSEIPTFATIGEKTYIVTPSRQRVFKAGSVFAPGVAAPSTPPSLISLTASSTAVVVVAPGWDYVVTYYDGTHETDSGPSPALTVLRPDGTEPAKVKISLPVSEVSTITKRKIWKRRRNTDVFFLVDIVEDNTTTEYEDTVDQPSSEVLESFEGIDVTADWPEDVSGVSEHEGRLVVWSGRQVQYSEVGDGERWYALNSLNTKAEVRACLSHEGRHFVFTDRTVEVVEGDFIRGSSGAMAVSHKVLDTSKGAFGPYAASVGRGRLFWVDPVGVHIMGQGTDQRDVTQTVSWPVNPMVQNAVDTAGTTVVVDFNHVSQDMWICLTQANQSSSTKSRICLVFNLESGKWTVFDHPLSWVCRVNDGLFGQQFYGCDYFGNLLELDVCDGDGIQGNESWFTAGGLAITSISGNTITFTGTSLPTTLRGCSAVLEDTSSTETPFYRRTILSSTATTITLDSMPAAIAAADKVHIGGIIGMIETGEADLGTPEEKSWHNAILGLSDLTRADL